MRWTLGATAQRRHLLDMMSTSLSPTSLHATVLEPLAGLLVHLKNLGFIFAAVQGRWDRSPHQAPGTTPRSARSWDNPGQRMQAEPTREPGRYDWELEASVGNTLQL